MTRKHQALSPLRPNFPSDRSRARRENTTYLLIYMGTKTPTLKFHKKRLRALDYDKLPYTNRHKLLTHLVHGGLLELFEY